MRFFEENDSWPNARRQTYSYLFSKPRVGAKLAFVMVKSWENSNHSIISTLSLEFDVKENYTNKIIWDVSDVNWIKLVDVNTVERLWYNFEIKYILLRKMIFSIRKRQERNTRPADREMKDLISCKRNTDLKFKGR